VSEIIERGHQAERILQDPLMAEALETIEQSIRESWDSATTTEVREELWYTLKGMQRFKQYLGLAIEQGEYETALTEKTNATS
jgi:hypothetical protein